ncbi:MAG: lauroyl acyltransferase [Rhodobacterales bacterium]|nr:MAG: lauroyl acyltransferase [Rhodobacterales bacterium]
MREPKRGIGAYLTNLILRTIIGLAMLLPYRWRVPALGWVVSRLIAPLAGYRRRIRRNLALIFPDLPQAEVKRICREVPDNAGRMLAELYSPTERAARHADLPLTGPGVAALEQAKADGRPIIAVSGHIGSYDALGLVFKQQGYKIGALYRPLRNGYFNDLYVQQMAHNASTLFEQSRRGLARMIRHLKEGNMIAILTDQRDPSGAPLTFFGHTAYTPLSAAELALKHDAHFFCCYGIRQDNGLDFTLVVEEPIPHSDPETMMQAVNDSLEARVRAHMGQWLWVHIAQRTTARERLGCSTGRRGTERFGQRRRIAARIGPGPSSTPCIKTAADPSPSITTSNTQRACPSQWPRVSIAVTTLA